MSTYTVLIYEAEPDEGGYWATVAELPGCNTSGETLDEIKANIPDAIDAYFDGLEAKGEAAPPIVAFKLEMTVG